MRPRTEQRVDPGLMQLMQTLQMVGSLQGIKGQQQQMQQEQEMMPYKQDLMSAQTDLYGSNMRNGQWDQQLQTMDWLNKQRATNPNYGSMVNDMPLEEMGIPRSAYPTVDSNQILQLLATAVQGKQAIDPGMLAQLQRAGDPQSQNVLNTYNQGYGKSHR